MDERSNQEAFCTTTLEQNVDASIARNRHTCQSEVIRPSVEECATNILTIESLSLASLSTENISPINDQSDDVPLLSIPSMQNNERKCSQYGLEILVCLIVLILATTLIVAGILITKRSTTFSESTVDCNKQSETGKSCSVNGLKTTVLISLENPSSTTDPYYSFVYTALSSRSVITFFFTRGDNWYLDDVSISDTSSKVELIEDGGFESGTMYAYCLCDSSFDLTKPTLSSEHSGSYVCYVKTFFSPIQLSQTVNTTAGRNYNVSFWLRDDRSYSFENRATIYMSTAFSTHEHFVLLLLKRFIIIFLIFYIISI